MFDLKLCQLNQVLSEVCYSPLFKASQLYKLQALNQRVSRTMV